MIVICEDYNWLGNVIFFCSSPHLPYLCSPPPPHLYSSNRVLKCWDSDWHKGSYHPNRSPLCDASFGCLAPLYNLYECTYPPPRHFISNCKTVFPFQIHLRCANSVQSVVQGMAIASERRRLSRGPRKNRDTYEERSWSHSYWTSPIWRTPRPTSLTITTVSYLLWAKNNYPRQHRQLYPLVWAFRVSVVALWPAPYPHPPQIEDGRYLTKRRPMYWKVNILRSVWAVVKDKPVVVRVHLVVCRLIFHLQLVLRLHLQNECDYDTYGPCLLIILLYCYYWHTHAIQYWFHHVATETCLCTRLL